MSKCPFWSSMKVKVECYNECPMNPKLKEDDVCIFKEYLNIEKINVKEIDNRFLDFEEDKYDLSSIGIKSY